MSQPLFMQIPLQGRSLIEASAGTGKTWTLAALYLRLLLDPSAPRSVQSILAVTFTDAATVELKTRIREWIQIALNLLQKRPTPDLDPVIQEAIEAILSEASTTTDEELEAKLRQALSDFDLASISTLHGFCSRALSTHALSGGLLLESELNRDTSELQNALVARFLREELLDCESTFPFSLPSMWLKTEAWRKLFQKHQNHLKAVLEPRLSFDALMSSQERQELWSEIQTMWMDDHELICESLTKCIRGYGRYMTARKALLDLFLEADTFSSIDLGEKGDAEKCLHYFRQSVINSSKTLKGKDYPNHIFFSCIDELGDELQRIQDALLASAQRAFLEWMDRELDLSMRAARMRAFHNQVADLATALASSKGTELAKRVRASYTAALIDEFQDTDPTQTDIFNAIYPLDCASPLILVGDPKQSIYRFRGADVMAYTDTASDLEQSSYRLETNFRAQPELLKAVQTLLHTGDEESTSGFTYGASIGNPSSLPKPGQVKELHQGGTKAPALILNQATILGDKACSKPLATKICLTLCAQDIYKMLRQDAQIVGEKKRKLQAQDICVLLGRHKDVQALASILGSCGIPSSFQDKRSVCASREAAWLIHFFSVLAQPQNASLCRGFLTLPLFNFSVEALRDGSKMLEVQQHMDGLKLELEKRGCLALVSRLLQEGLLPGLPSWNEQLLKHSGSRRSIANLRHLAELLHELEAECGRDPAALLRALQTQREERSENQEMRLESDENLVRIMTIHGSKGLEFPVVFAPLLWALSSNGTKIDTAEVHHEELESCSPTGKKHRAVLTMGKTAYREDVRARIDQEAKEESARQVYVALTRASLQLYLYAGNFKGCYHVTANKSGKLKENFPSSPFGQLLGKPEWARFAEDSGQTIQVRPHTFSETGELMQAPKEEAMAQSSSDSALAQVLPTLAARQFPQAMTAQTHSSFHLSSFSQLLRQESKFAHDFSTNSARSESPTEDTSESARPEIPLPAGASFGSFVHDILERLPFASIRSAEPWESALKPLLDAGLSRGVIEEKHFDGMRALLAHTLYTPLGQGLPALADFAELQIKKEMEFLFSNADIPTEPMKKILRERRWVVPNLSQEEIELGLEKMLSRLPERISGGFFKGFIDLSFVHEGQLHIADYKSNRLDSYSPQALWMAMCDHGYILQYLIYSIAQKRLLALSNANPELGGAYYLFLRGMQESCPGSGIYYDPLDDGIVDRLDLCLRENGSTK
jgi:exodeoxyribonuclease V beta subunit